MEVHLGFGDAVEAAFFPDWRTQGDHFYLAFMGFLPAEFIDTGIAHHLVEEKFDFAGLQKGLSYPPEFYKGFRGNFFGYGLVLDDGPTKVRQGCIIVVKEKAESFFFAFLQGSKRLLFN